MTWCDAMNDKEFGVLIKNARKKKGWSQEVLADESGISPQALSSIETGGSSPKLSTVVQLVRVLGLKTDNFIPTADQGELEQNRADLIVQISALADNLDVHGLSIMLEQAKVIRPYFKARK